MIIMTMQPATIASEHQIVGFLSDDQFALSAGHAAIKGIRDLLGRSSAASHYNRLDVKARAMICYAARLRPSTYAALSLDEMTPDERDEIRRAIITLRTINDAFSGVNLDRAEFMHIPHRSINSEEFRQAETKRRLELNAQARTLAARAAAINKFSSQGA